MPKSVKRISGGQEYMNIPIIAGIAPSPNRIIPGIRMSSPQISRIYKIKKTHVKMVICLMLFLNNPLKK